MLRHALAQLRHKFHRMVAGQQYQPNEYYDDRFRVGPLSAAVAAAAASSAPQAVKYTSLATSSPPLSPTTSERTISLEQLVPPEESLVEESKEGLCSPRALLFLALWYFFSFCTLFLNKYILSTLGGDATLLAAVQMLMTLCCGFVQMYLPCGMYQPIKREGKPPHFFRNMCFVGCTRFTTVVLGLVALKFVAVSFTETIKSSAPLFTAAMAYLLLGERTGLWTNLSLVPIMTGLALCSSYELSFNLIGFLAAVATNITECLQNVYSKMLVSGKHYKYTPAELQFYTSCASFVVQLPACVFMVDFDKASSHTSRAVAATFFLNGLFFHFQSITAYALMGYISPVTHSVANTGKRALLIWLSVIVFGNSVTVLSAAGTALVLGGVLLYNRAKEYDQAALDSRRPPPSIVLSTAPRGPLLPMHWGTRPNRSKSLAV